MYGKVGDGVERTEVRDGEPVDVAHGPNSACPLRQ